MRARSARGLSLSSYILETLAYSITLVYSFRHQFPFSTYGENFFITFQNALITLLIIFYALAPRSHTTQRLAIAVFATAGTFAVLSAVPQGALAVLQLCTLPISLSSKLPQIRQNARARSTGQLSAFAVLSQIAGCLARLFTTATEVGDGFVAAGYAMALALNIVLGAQLWLYWGRDGDFDEKKVDDPSSWRQKHDGVVPVASPPQSPSTRKWARKVCFRSLFAILTTLIISTGC